MKYKRLLLALYIILIFLFNPIIDNQQVIAQSENTGNTDEQLLFLLPDGWKEEFNDRTDSLSTTEYVPVAQSGDDWDEMLTIQILLDKPSSDPVKMMSGITNYLSKNCSAFDYKPIDIGGIDNNYPSLAVLVLCGREKDESQGYVSLLRGISGEENYFLLQKSWKTKPYDIKSKTPINLEQRKFWLGYLSYLRICNQKRGNCPKNVKLD